MHLSASTCGLVAMTSASHAEGRQFDPGQVYFLYASAQRCICNNKEVIFKTAGYVSMRFCGHELLGRAPL